MSAANTLLENGRMVALEKSMLKLQAKATSGMHGSNADIVQGSNADIVQGIEDPVEASLSCDVSGVKTQGAERLEAAEETADAHRRLPSFLEAEAEAPKAEEPITELPRAEEAPAEASMAEEPLPARHIEALESNDDLAAAKAARATALRKVYRHYFLTCCQTVMPFSQKSKLILSLPGFDGNVSKVAVFAASMASTSGVVEFVLCPILGKLSDTYGRKAFMKLGPLADLIFYGLVFAKPSVQSLWLQSILGTTLNTFSGTTCAGASIMDIFRGAPEELGAAFGGLLTPVGAGLVCGPLIGQAMVKLGGGRPEMAYLGASVCAAVQLANVQCMEDSLPADMRKPFSLSLADINPLGFMDLFRIKGRSALAKLSLMTGFLQKADEGKNLADLHQVYALKDVGMSEVARGNFVSFIGACVLLGARTSKFTLRHLGGRGHTTFSNTVSIAALALFASVPRWFKNSKVNWWPMFLGILVSSLGWNADADVKARGAAHAEAAGIGNGDYSAKLANMRSVMSSLAPSLYARMYAWSTSGGRKMPGLAYVVSALFKVLAELTHQSMSNACIQNV